ncbi:MAG: RluA family pseudouridine synthase [Treponema sp.]|nr:RluA family pseudouridine synthase [Treponema sp.]
MEKIEILYQDQWLVVINKPAGLLSVPYSGCKWRTAQSLLEDILRKRGSVNARHKPYAVHRLDRDTSGVMMFALNEQAQEKIMDSWHKMVSERLYHALAEISYQARRNPLSDSGLIDDDLSQNAYNIGFVPKEGALDKSGHSFKTMPARTHYKMLEKGKSHVLFELSLDTGKKNQIRAHLAAHGYPIAGDEEHRAQTNPFNRLCLHARTLEFTHPFTGEKLKFEVPEPAAWNEYVKKGDSFNNHSKRPVENYKKSEDFASKRPLTGKQKSHMNFIERGKNYRK